MEDDTLLSDMMSEPDSELLSEGYFSLRDSYRDNLKENLKELESQIKRSNLMGSLEGIRESRDNASRDRARIGNTAALFMLVLLFLCYSPDSSFVCVI